VNGVDPTAAWSARRTAASCRAREHRRFIRAWTSGGAVRHERAEDRAAADTDGRPEVIVRFASWTVALTLSCGLTRVR
jgi:hypothetical protein